ncbi:MAG: D-hexose-6-phosphate mutarotase [Aeromonas sp.]
MSTPTALPATCCLHQNAAGLPILTVHNAWARADISLFGGHVLHYQRHNQAPLIWLSDSAVLDGSKAIRGGIPICWPWFGPAPAHVGAEKPAHGFARTSQWQLDAAFEEAHGTRVHLSLCANDATRALWPHEFTLELDVLIGDKLSLVLTTTNTGDTPLTFGGALHTYLAVAAIHATQVSGLGVPYADKLTGSDGTQQGALTFTGALDRIYTAPSALVTITDTARSIRVQNGHHDSVVVWNPWANGAKAFADMPDDGYLSMLCVEAALTAPAGVTLAADEEYSLSSVIA